MRSNKEMKLSSSISAIRICEHGDVSKLEHAQVELEAPGPGQVRVALQCAGVNYIDIYQREGLYPLKLPAVLGNEGAGEVIAVGDEVADVSVGDSVAFCSGSSGAYAQQTNVAADRLVRLPEGFAQQEAGAIMLKGLTAEYLARRCWPICAGDAVAVTAAAGGVGRLLCQWLQRLGACVVGIVGGEEKAKVAKQSGCEHVLAGYTDLGLRIREIFSDGVHAVYDSVGADTFHGSLDALRKRGCLITYGNASGLAPAVRPLDLAGKGSLFITRPVLNHYVSTSKQLRAAAATLFGEIERGLQLPPIVSWPLAEAATVHRTMQNRDLDGIASLATQS